MKTSLLRVELKVNGKEVSLNPFANSIVGNTIWGLISSLTLEEEPKRIEVKVSPGDKQNRGVTCDSCQS